MNLRHEAGSGNLQIEERLLVSLIQSNQESESLVSIFGSEALLTPGESVFNEVNAVTPLEQPIFGLHAHPGTVSRIELLQPVSGRSKGTGSGRKWSLLR